jgi:YD repeat-containing protein
MLHRSGTNVQTSASFGYDALDRLTNAQLPAVSYGYDANGNRTSQTTGGMTRNYTIDAASNRLQSVSGTLARSFTHDAAGNFTNAVAAPLAHDILGRLKLATRFSW